MNRDPLCHSVVLSSTPEPQKLCWQAAHQDYSHQPVYTSKINLTESHYGTAVINHCLKFGHFGVTEHPQITFNCAYYPHEVISQARTHRVSCSFDVQSFRYTSESVTSITTFADLERAFYFRPVGTYADRQGRKYEYTELQRHQDNDKVMTAVGDYKRKVSRGMPLEQARGLLPYNYRQHFVVSFNARSLMHFLDLRSKKDAQLEIQWLAEDFFTAFKLWMPEIAAFYEETRLHKARLSP
jgi:thymidylate synthase (FAD)